MKEKITTIVIIAMLLTAIVPMIKVSGVNPVTELSHSGDSHLTPQQKMSSQLIELLKEAEIDDAILSKQVRILVRHNSAMQIQMPTGVEVLNRFNIVPIVSAIAPVSMIEEISMLPGVEYVYSDMQMHIASNEGMTLPKPDYSKIKDWKDAEVVDEEFPSDPWFGEYPAYLNETTGLIGARQLWDLGITGKGVTIAIIDTGINKYHPDLDDMDDDPTTHDPKVLAERSFVPYEPSPEDTNGHGTHVASTAVGTGGTGAMGFYGQFPYYGIHNATILPGTERGVAPGAYLYNAKAFDSGGSADWSWIIGAIEWSVAMGADVISGSFGGWPEGPPEQDPVVLALKAAVEHGVVVVIAAGNDGWGYFSVGTPGFAPDVITVGATTETDELIFFSSRGPEQFELHAKPDILAPGTSVIAAFTYFREIEEYEGYQLFYLDLSGTSMATPHVSGAAALLLQAFPGATPYSVKAAMMLGADDLGLNAMAQGAGRLNVKNAYDLMNAAPKAYWEAEAPTETVEHEPLAATEKLNLTGKRIGVDVSICNPMQFMRFFTILNDYGAILIPIGGPYANDTLVDPGTGEPYFDVFMLSEPYVVDTLFLPPSVLENYVNHNGTLLFIGDSPMSSPEDTPMDYNDWTEVWGITWNNTAVGGKSTHITAHSITNGITEIYFGNPISSLIVDTSMQAETVAWDPIFPAIAVWETPAPATGKVVVIADDGVLSDQYLYVSDNLQLGLNIIQWFTATSEIQYLLFPYFFDDFESGVGLWSATGLWHITDHRSYSPFYAWYYGQEGIWTFDTGARNWGSLTSPVMDLTGQASAILEFSYWYQTETMGTSFDQRWVLISVDAGPFVPLRQLSGDPMGIWQTGMIDLSSYVGHTVQIQFYFDTVDEIMNDYEGWYIDDVRVNVGLTDYHDIAVGGTWPKYVLANTTATVSVNVTNFGTYTEDIELYMNGINMQTIADLAPGTSTIADLSMQLNATLICDESGVNMTSLFIEGSIVDSEIDYSNNAFSADIAAVPKTERAGDNPLLHVIAPMKIDSTTAPLITMYPDDFALHNMTAFIAGGELTNAKFQITGSVAQIADFIDVEEFTYHTLLQVEEDLWLPDPSPAYFLPNMTAIIGDTLNISDTTAPAMLSAELQVYITDDVAPGTYSGSVELVNGTTVLASSSLTFQVKNPKYRVLWEDYYNSMPDWIDCERLWGGAFWGYGVFEWWKLVSEAGFDVDSLHQQTYFERHVGYVGTEAIDPFGIIAYGGYNALYMQDMDFRFSPDHLSVLRQLYETGKMDFVVLFDGGSEVVSSFTSYYGIAVSEYSYVMDLVITEFEKTHPIFSGVNNFTLFDGPTLTTWAPEDTRSVTTGIATGTIEFAPWINGFAVAVNEMHATSHLTSRMVAVSDSNTFESLEYEDFMVWYYTLSYTGKGIVSHVDTDKFAVNILRWLDPQFANEAPVVDYFDATPAPVELGETVSIDTIVHDPEDDTFNVTIAIKAPDDTWNNATVFPVGGHWLRSFTADMEGPYEIYVVATDSLGATTTMLGGTVNSVNVPPEIVSVSISPSRVTQGKKVFITLNAKDAEDGVPATIKITITDPNDTSYDFNFANVAFATATFDTSGMPEGIYTVTALLKDSNDATTTATIGSFEVENLPPKITYTHISPSKVTVGEVVFIAVNTEDPEDIIPAKITVDIINPSGSRTSFNFSNIAVANVVFNTNGKAEGVYQVEVEVEDSNGKTTSAVVGSFEIKAAPIVFPAGIATFGLGIIGLILLAIAVLLLSKRLPAAQSPPPTT
jgi:hypothetical protein